MNTSDGVIGMRDLAKLTHLTRKTISIYNNQLQDLGFMVNGRGRVPDILENGGCKNNVKIYDPRSYGQAVLFALRNHEDRLNDIQDEQRKDIEELTAEIKNLKLQQAISDLRSFTMKTKSCSKQTNVCMTRLTLNFIETSIKWHFKTAKGGRTSSYHLFYLLPRKNALLIYILP